VSATVQVEAALDLLAGLVLEDGRRWGEAAADFQWQDAQAVLDPASETPYHFLTRARGGSKTSDLAGMAIVALLAQLPPGSRLYALAADRDQGRLLIDSVAGLATRTPELRGLLDVQAYRVAAVRNGSLLEVLAADAPGAWGLRPDFLVVDELAQWGQTYSARRLWEAASSAIAKTKGRMAVLTTAGDPAHWSRKILDHALADPLWRVHQVPGPPPWMDGERLAEQRRRLLDSSFRRLFLNEWISAEDRLASDEDIAACVVLDGPLAPEVGKQYVIGLDVGLKHDRTVAAVCHGETVRMPTMRRPGRASCSTGWSPGREAAPTRCNWRRSSAGWSRQRPTTVGPP
jgi:phage terminase large subunit-like protein